MQAPAETFLSVGFSPRIEIDTLGCFQLSVEFDSEINQQILSHSPKINRLKNCLNNFLNLSHLSNNFENILDIIVVIGQYSNFHNIVNFRFNDKFIWILSWYFKLVFFNIFTFVQGLLYFSVFCSFLFRKLHETFVFFSC